MIFAIRLELSHGFTVSFCTDCVLVPVSKKNTMKAQYNTMQCTMKSLNKQRFLVLLNNIRMKRTQRMCTKQNAVSSR